MFGLGVVWTDDQTGYVFCSNSSTSFAYYKTTDAGATWAAPVDISTGDVGTLSVWYDQWTNGDSGTLIHIWWVNLTSDDCEYRNLDTSDDTLSTMQTVFNGGSVNSSTSNITKQCTGTKARGGNLYVQFWLDTVGERGFYRSTDGGANWTSRTDGADGNAVDLVLLNPGDETDSNDVWMVYHDRSAEEVSLKVYDNSADSWSETSIVTGIDDMGWLEGWGFTPRHSDNHSILAVWTDIGSADPCELKVFDIGGASSITAKTSPHGGAGFNDGGWTDIFIDQDSDDLYVTYVCKDDASQAIFSLCSLFYKKSTNGGTSWGSETALDDGFTDDMHRCPAGKMRLAAANGRMQVVFINRDLRDLITGVDGAIGWNVSPAATLTGTALPTATEAEIVAGGETIVITLANDTWVASGATFDAQRQAILDGLTSAGAEAAGWNAVVRDTEAVSAVVRTSDTVVTITLSAAAAYNTLSGETITVTVPAAAVVTSATPLVATPTFDVPAGAVTVVERTAHGSLRDGFFPYIVRTKHPDTRYVIGGTWTKTTQGDLANFTSQGDLKTPAPTENFNGAAWYGPWNTANTDTLIHTISLTNESGDLTVYYQTIDPENADAKGTLRTIETIVGDAAGGTGNGAWAMTCLSSLHGHSASIAKAESGRLYVYWGHDNLDRTKKFNLYSSDDSGVTWDAVADVPPGSNGDRVTLFPNKHSADAHDMYALVYDISGDVLQLWEYGASINTWIQRGSDLASRNACENTDAEYHGMTWDRATGDLYIATMDGGGGLSSYYATLGTSGVEQRIWKYDGTALTLQHTFGGPSPNGFVGHYASSLHYGDAGRLWWCFTTDISNTSNMLMVRESLDDGVTWSPSRNIGDGLRNRPGEIRSALPLPDQVDPYFLWREDLATADAYIPSPGPTATGPATALSGTATLSATETDVAAGGKTIIITLSQDTWVTAGATFDAQRQAIIDGISAASSPTTGWNNEVRDKEVVGAVGRTSDTVVTVTLSARSTYAIASDETITATIPAAALVTSAVPIAATPTFDVAAIAAVVSGTGMPALTQADIVAGGNTLLLTLTHDTWVAAGAPFDAQRQAIINGLDSAQSEANGWDAEVKAKLAVTAVVRTSDTVVTVTLSAQIAYAITADETITATIPAAALVDSASAVVAAPTMAVTTGSAAVTGTATPSLGEADVVTGGKTVIITLTADTWVAAGASFDAQRQAIIDGLDADGAESTGWNTEVRDKLAVTDVVRTSDTVVTVTLSAQSAYEITATETVTVTVPTSATVTSASDVVAAPTFDAEPIAAAVTGTATPNLTEADVVTGSKTIVVTLTHDTWVAAGASFDAQRQAIIDGLDADQSEVTGWNAEVRDKLAVTDVARTSDTVATVTLPAESGYAVTDDEQIVVTVPASALVSSSSNVLATPGPAFEVQSNDTQIIAGFQGETEWDQRCLVWTTEKTGFLFYRDASRDLRYVKSDTAGLTWEPAVLVALAAASYRIWYDRWTPGDEGTTVHIAYHETTNDKAQYRSFDTLRETLGTAVDIFAGTGFVSNASTRQSVNSIAKTVGGTLLAAGWGNTTGSKYTRKSIDGGATWSDIATVLDGDAVDPILLFPGNATDTRDAICLYWDASANEISRKTYDDSANSCSETSIATGMTEAADHFSWGASVCASDGHVILAAWNAVNSASGDLQVWDVDSTSITAKTNVVTDSAFDSCAVFTTHPDGAVISVCYANGSSTSRQTVFRNSTDGGTTWGDETELQRDPAGDIGTIALDLCSPFTFRPVYWDRDVDAYFSNVATGTTLGIEPGQGDSGGLDVTIGAAHPTSQLFANQYGLVWTDADSGYQCFVNASNHLVYRKTADGGATWGNEVTVRGGASDHVESYSVWYDRWTPDDPGSTVHIAWVDDNGDAARYRSLDTATDTLGTDTQIASHGSFGSNQANHSRDFNSVAITKTRNGKLYVAYWVNNAAGTHGFYQSSDGTTWASKTNVADGDAVDQVLLLPSDAVDDDDLIALYWDVSANEISRKLYDASANSWAETAIVSATASDQFPQWGAAMRHSDRHVIMAAWTEPPSASADLVAYEITSSSVAALPNVETDLSGAMLAGVHVGANTNDVFVCYAAGEHDGEVAVRYRVIRDGSAVWSSEQVCSTNTPDDLRLIPVDPWAEFAREMSASYFNDDLSGLFINTLNNGTCATLPQAVVHPGITGEQVRATSTPFDQFGSTLPCGNQPALQKCAFNQSGDGHQDTLYDNCSAWDFGWVDCTPDGHRCSNHVGNSVKLRVSLNGVWVALNPNARIEWEVQKNVGNVFGGNRWILEYRAKVWDDYDPADPEQGFYYSPRAALKHVDTVFQLWPIGPDLWRTVMALDATNMSDEAAVANIASTSLNGGFDAHLHMGADLSGVASFDEGDKINTEWWSKKVRQCDAGGEDGAVFVLAQPPGRTPCP